MSFYVSALTLGLAFFSLCLGIFISLKIFNIPDITTDGSYTLGAAVTAICLTNQVSLPITFLLVICSGAIAGLITAFITTKFKINALLAGILVMTALYSVNLKILGRSNVPLIDVQNIFNWNENKFLAELTILSLAVAVLILFFSWLLKTDFGLTMQATGVNETMVKSIGSNPNKIKIIGLAISNALVALSGFFIAQLQGFADINMGIGIVIMGLGSVMIGDAFSTLFKINSIGAKIVMVLVGAILFRILLAFALSVGVDPVWLKLITAVFVLIVVAIPTFKLKTS